MQKSVFFASSGFQVSKDNNLETIIAWSNFSKYK